jgi:hypothetical protein
LLDIGGEGERIDVLEFDPPVLIPVEKLFYRARRRRAYRGYGL